MGTLLTWSESHLGYDSWMVALGGRRDLAKRTNSGAILALPPPAPTRGRVLLSFPFFPPLVSTATAMIV